MKGGNNLATIRTSIMIEDMMSRQFQAMNMSMMSVIDAFEQIESASSGAIDVTALRHAHSELQNIESEFSQIEREIQQSEDAQERLNRDFRDGENFARNLLGTIGAIAGTYLSIQGIGEVFRISDEMTDTQARVQLLVDEMPLTNSVDSMQQTINELNNMLALDATLDSSKVQQELKAIEQSMINVDVKTDTAELAELSQALSQIQTDLDVNVSINGMTEAQQAQQLIFESAQRSYSSFKDTADMVSRVGSNAGDAFSNMSEVIAFTELVQKQFGIAGANAVEAGNATIQLSQALASGVLRGDELNSIFEQAPNLIRSIADYLEVPMGSIREMASNGEITADIIKNAMFAASDEINNKFNSMPTTWSQIWTSIKNDALWAFSDILASINDVANTDRFKEFLSSFKTGLYVLGDVANAVFNSIRGAGALIYDNWSWIAPVALGLSLIFGSIISILAVVGLIKLASLAWAAAQWVVNTAYLSNPITWVLIAIIVVIGLIIYALVAWGEQTATVIAYVVGLFAALGAFIFNIFANIANFLTIFAEFFINLFIDPVYAVKKLFYDLVMMVIDNMTAMAGSFDTAATVLGNAFVSGANIAIRAINWVIEALKKIPGIELDTMKELSTGKSNVITQHWQNFADNLQAPTSDKNVVSLEKTNLMSIPDTAAIAAEWAYNGTLTVSDSLNGLVDKAQSFSLTDSFTDLTDFAGLDLDNLATGVGGLEDAIGKGNAAGRDTANNTDKLADSATMLEEDLKYLRDAAEREAINRYTTAEIKVDMKNENHINSEMDIDGVIDKFGERVEEVVEMLAEGGPTDDV